VVKAAGAGRGSRPMRAVAVVAGPPRPAGDRPGLAGAALRGRPAARGRRTRARAGVAHAGRGARALARTAARAAIPVVDAAWWAAPVRPHAGRGTRRPGAHRGPRVRRRRARLVRVGAPTRRSPPRWPGCRARWYTATPTAATSSATRSSTGATPRVAPRGSRPWRRCGAQGAVPPPWFAESPGRDWADVHVHVQYLGFAADHLGAAPGRRDDRDGRRRPRPAAVIASSRAPITTGLRCAAADHDRPSVRRRADHDVRAPARRSPPACGRAVRRSGHPADRPRCGRSVANAA